MDSNLYVRMIFFTKIGLGMTETQRTYDSLLTTISVLPISFHSCDSDFKYTTMNGSLLLR